MKRYELGIRQGETLIGYATLTGVLQMVPHPRSNIVMRIRRGAFVEPAFIVPGGFDGRGERVWNLDDVDAWVKDNPYRKAGGNRYE